MYLPSGYKLSFCRVLIISVISENMITLEHLINEVPIDSREGYIVHPKHIWWGDNGVPGRK